MRIKHQHYQPQSNEAHQAPDLFEPRLARPSVPVETSEAAAESMKGIAPKIRARIVAWLKDRGSWGATEQEVEVALGLSGNTVRPRLFEAQEAGEIERTDKTRPTRSRRKAFVYRVR